MSDAELRRLERRWQESGSDEDELRYLRTRWRDAPETLGLPELWRLYTLGQHDTDLRAELWTPLYRSAAAVQLSGFDGPPLDLEDGLPRQWGDLLVCGPIWPAPREPSALRAWDGSGPSELVLDARPPLAYPRMSVEEATKQIERESQLTHENLAILRRAGLEVQGHMVSDYRGANRLLDASAPWALDDALRCVRALADAVSLGHEAGFVHGSIGLQFILQRDDGSPVMIPFGAHTLARVGPDDEHITRPMRFNELGFLSPTVVAAGGHTSAACDVFALGTLLYRLLAGVLPWVRDSVVQYFMAVFQDRHTPLAHHRPELHVHVGRLIDTCLAKEASDRYPDAGALRDDLDVLLAVLLD